MEFKELQGTDILDAIALILVIVALLVYVGIFFHN